jgi:WD40-like Beta Propeller Repeat
MRLLAMLARLGAEVHTAGLYPPRPFAKGGEKKKMMAKTNPWGALALAAAGSLVAVGLVVLIMVIVEAHPAEATFPGNPGKISYSGYDGQGFEIYTINTSGGGGRFNVTDNSTPDYAPSYSPSGNKIAYSGQDAQGGDWEIYTINPGGGGKVKVTDNSTDDYYPS